MGGYSTNYYYYYYYYYYTIYYYWVQDTMDGGSGRKKEGKEMFSLPSTVPSNWKNHPTDLFNLPC